MLEAAITFASPSKNAVEKKNEKQRYNNFSLSRDLARPRDQNFI